jgi:ATP-dependent helicase/nuclease subunit B
MLGRDPNVSSIPPSAPFLSTLVDALLTGKLVEGFAPNDDPLALSSVTIWVPTRRAARALATEFVERLQGKPALLPNIKALGDADDDMLNLDESEPAASLESSLSSLERQLVLSRLVLAWSQSLRPDQVELLGGGDIIIPSSLADAVRFSTDLARLMDTVATEEVSWDSLHTLVPDDHEKWWQLTLEFLKIATSIWPALLQERGAIDSSAERVSSLRLQADAYEKAGSIGPVIAAGSTGSIPATAHLLRVISRMENGSVVLPGLDRDLDAETWAKIDLPDNDRDDDGTAPGHPQYGLRKLLRSLDVDRENVSQIGGVENSSTGHARVREQLISEAMRPSFSTGQWQNVFKIYSEEQRDHAFEGVTLLEAQGEREEALSIALALRETLTDPSKSAALVTPDRNLARRVAVEMRRFGLDVDDSAGLPLRTRPAGTFARLVLKVAFETPDPVALVALLKHPLLRFGEEPQKVRDAARALELVVLRDAVVAVRFGDFQKTVQDTRLNVANKKARVHRAVRRFTDQDWQACEWLGQQLDLCFAGLQHTGSAIEFHELASRSASLIETCGRDHDGSLKSVYEGEDGKSLYGLLGELMEQREDISALPDEWPEIFDALLSQKVVRPVGGAHPRVSILGPLEARLQTYDRIVLGGLNEKSWPAAARNDPFLSRPMKSALGLPPPERRTGLAAHDFQVLLGMKDVVLTRSTKADNAPTVASRWVQRLSIIAGEKSHSAMQRRGKVYLDWAAQIDQPEHPPKACAQPKPTPPVSARPKGLPITDIETWIKDPYAIYAKRILKLSALGPLMRDADAREKGTLFHEIFEDFVASQGPLDIEPAYERLINIAREKFASSVLPPEIQAMWWPRFETIAEAFVVWHREMMKDVAKTFIELDGQTSENLDGFILRGRADRIDLLNDDRIALLDYKTGTKPSASAVKTHEAPQLPLEAAMAARGAFGPELQKEAAELAYVRLRPEEKLKVDRIGHDDKGKKDADAATLAEQAWQRLALLVSEYQQQDMPYRSKARFISENDWASDYDHLARVSEWSTAEEGADE